ncbi:daptide biosynthesis RiPP recognition protein [Streptomyces sp. JJ38]|uniref:daptide biosynthesis RiPP recognition protein n=1 Tax=Streptomyces sp. JJ38 TaxID=2738128 RepID=UPI001C57E88A|nr:daptide biosynthesis RiPP recognition protein [Streptomyces sp. JJ38]MBW1596584.1 hypothetical protein [Streptomyces sp. JJ38]
MVDHHTSLAKRHLVSWGTGTRHRQAADAEPAARPGALTVVLEDAGLLPAVLGGDLAGPHSLVLAPGVASSPLEGPEPGSPVVVGYEGSAAQPGDELSIGDSFFLQTQEYSASQFMSVIGPTLIRVFDGSDFAAYLADADRARAEGVFPAFATDPVIRLADLPSLGASPAADGPATRLYADADGTVSTAPGGAALGSAGDAFADLLGVWERVNKDSAHPCAVGLGATVPEAERCASLAERPWLGRYLAALDALRELRARDVSHLRVSGFGGRLSETAEPVAEAADAHGTELPLLLWNEQGAYVHSTPTGRFFQIGTDAARIAETVLACGDAETAAERVDAAALAKVTAFFERAGVPLTGRTEAAR